MKPTEAIPGTANEAILRGDDSEREALGKQERLLAELGGIDSLLVAFSGGADSAYLAWAAHSALGNRALAITALSPSFSSHDREHAASFVRQFGLNHQFIRSDEFENPLYVSNNADRCYHCKDELFSRMEKLARERGFAALAYGINTDDRRDFRPGHRAASEHCVLAPLLDAGLCKAEIRMLSRRAGLPTWDRPASACLSSRVAYGIAVTPERLSRIERGEQELRRLGFHQFRLRDHGQLARIEIASEEMPLALTPEMAQQMAQSLRPLGYDFVTLDLEGYRQGSLNRELRKSKPR